MKRMLEVHEMSPEQIENVVVEVRKLAITYDCDECGVPDMLLDLFPEVDDG